MKKITSKFLKKEITKKNQIQINGGYTGSKCEKSLAYPAGTYDCEDRDMDQTTSLQP